MQVEKCSHCLLVLGAVGSTVAVSNCDSITVVTACRKLHVRYIEMITGLRIIHGNENMTECLNNIINTFMSTHTHTHHSSSSLCAFHLLTMTRPLIFPSCFHLSLAPYNTHYPQLETHLLASGLSARVKNYWNDPLIIGNGRRSELCLIRFSAFCSVFAYH